MKNSIKIVSAVLILTLIFGFTGLTGCKKRQTPQDYLEKQIQQVKNGKSEILERVLTEELEAEAVDDFPDELKEGYLTFLKEVYANMKYEVGEAESKGKNQYRLVVTVEPLDLSGTVRTANEEYIANMQSADMVSEVKAVLALDQTELPNSGYTDKIDVSVRMDWEDKGYTVNEADFLSVLRAAAADKLTPYNAVAEVFDIQKYVQACLDAECKGEFAEYARQTGISEEEAAKARDEELRNAELEEAGFTEDEKSQFSEAVKTLLATTSYEVGIPRKTEEKHYTVEVHITPNISLQKCAEELMESVNSGGISNMDQLKQNFFETLNRYAAEPAYGEEQTMTVNVVLGEEHLLEIPEADYTLLMDTLLSTE